MSSPDESRLHGGNASEGVCCYNTTALATKTQKVYVAAVTMFACYGYMLADIVTLVF